MIWAPQQVPWIIRTSGGAELLRIEHEIDGHFVFLFLNCIYVCQKSKTWTTWGWGGRLSGPMLLLVLVTSSVWTQPSPTLVASSVGERQGAVGLRLRWCFFSSSPSSKKHTVYIPFRHIKHRLTCGRLCAWKSTKQAWSTSTQQSATTLKTTGSSRNRLVTTQSAGKPKVMTFMWAVSVHLNTLLQIERSPNGAGIPWWHSSPSRMLSAATPQQTSQKQPKEHDKKPTYLIVASHFPTSKSSLVF